MHPITTTTLVCLMLSTPAAARSAHRHHHRYHSHHRRYQRRDAGLPVLAINGEVRINSEGEVVSKPVATPGLDQVSRERGMRYQGPSY